MNKLKELQEKRGSLVKQIREALDTATNENRGLTADEQTRIAGIESECDSVSSLLDAEMRQLARESRNAPKLSERENRDLDQFDIGKVLRHLSAVGNGRSSIIDGIEAEMIQEGSSEARSAGLSATGVMLPQLICRRSQTVTGGTTTQYGGTLVATSKVGLLDDFYLKSALAQNGAMVMQGLSGNVDLPRWAKAATAPAKKTENASADDATGTFASLSLAPKRLPAYVDISDQLLMQSSAALDPFLRAAITSQLHEVQEIAFFHGTGTSEPRGIAATTGIGSVVGGTNGAAPTWAHLIALEAALDAVNAPDVARRLFLNSQTKAKLRNTRLISGSTDSNTIWKEINQTNETFNPIVTNAVSKTLTKGSSSGVASAIFYGNPADFVIGYWGGLMLEMVRDVTGAKQGQQTLVASLYYDGGVLRPKSWSAMLDALSA